MAKNEAAWLVKKHPKLNVLINNAGMMKPDGAQGVMDDGLVLATVTTLFVVPMVYSLLRTKPPVDHEKRIVEEEHEYLRDEMLLGEDLQ